MTAARMTPEESLLRQRGALVESLSGSLNDGSQDLATAIGALEQVIEQDAWREFITHDGRHFGGDNKPRTFIQFVTLPRAQGGIGLKMEKVKEIISNSIVLRERLDGIIHQERPHGTNQHSFEDLDNIQVLAPTGTSRDRALRRLREDRPKDDEGRDLFELVLAEKMSPHAAMVTAKFRHPTFSVQADDPAAFIRAGLRRYTREELLAALEL